MSGQGFIQHRLAADAARRSAAGADLERLRSDYALILGVAQVWLQIVKESQFVRQAETEDTRNARLSSLLSEAQRPARDARIRLAMDESAADVIAAYDATWKAYFDHQLAQSDAPGLERSNRIRKAVENLEAELQNLEAVTRKHLKSLADARTGDRTKPKPVKPPVASS